MRLQKKVEKKLEKKVEKAVEEEVEKVIKIKGENKLIIFFKSTFS